jgi:CheY-like chemotaxis protein
MSTKRILVADDEPHIARVIELFLRREGFQVELARDGQEALESILRNAPDALITDVQMPRMNGQQLCGELQRRLPERDFKIIVMTSMTNREHRDWSGEMRDVTFMEKQPVSMRSVVAALKDYFAKGLEAEGAPHA